MFLWKGALLEVALLAPLPADLAEQHGGEEADVPGEQVQPELVLEAGALGEVGEVLADGGGERREERGVAVRLDGDAGGDGPAEQRQEVHRDVRLEPVVVEGLGLTASSGEEEGRAVRKRRGRRGFATRADESRVGDSTRRLARLRETTGCGGALTRRSSWRARTRSHGRRGACARPCPGCLWR